jgi:hypothetical protein
MLQEKSVQPTRYKVLDTIFFFRYIDVFCIVLRMTNLVNENKHKQHKEFYIASIIHLSLYESSRLLFFEASCTARSIAIDQNDS